VLNGGNIVVQQDNGNGNFAGNNVEVSDNHKILLKNVGLFDGTQNYNVYLTSDPVRTFKFKISSTQLTVDCVL